MTALIEAIIFAIIVLGVGTYLVIWTLDHVKNDTIRTGAIILYGLCFILTVVNLVIEAIKVGIYRDIL